MRIFALSDIHIDYDANAEWVGNLSKYEYRDDLLILAGDITHRLALLAWCVSAFSERFKQVLFVPGNHDLWVLGEEKAKTSLQKFMDVKATIEDCGASMRSFRKNGVHIVPLQGWYDYSFGEPSEDLMHMWSDYRACRWPADFGPVEAAAYFAKMNADLDTSGATRVITFSHFLPRIDLVPFYVPRKHRILDPVLGSAGIDAELRGLGSSLHVYGHSHINRSVRIDGVRYVNNAFGYPQESMIASKQLLCIDEI
jgi:predicted phosphodiesterase